MTEADRLLAYSAAVKAKATAEEKVRDPVLMLCELLVLAMPDEIRKWVNGADGRPMTH